MVNPGALLLKWWKAASPRKRWTAGILVFSLLCSFALFLLSDSPSSTAAYGAADLDTSPLFLVSVLLKLLFVIGLFVGGAVVFRHYSTRLPQRCSRKHVEIVETVRLSPRQALHLIRAGDRYLLVGATDQAFSLISEINALENQPETAPLPAAVSAQALAKSVSFENVLSALTSRAKGMN